MILCEVSKISKPSEKVQKHFIGRNCCSVVFFKFEKNPIKKVPVTKWYFFRFSLIRFSSHLPGFQQRQETDPHKTSFKWGGCAVGSRALRFWAPIYFFAVLMISSETFLNICLYLLEDNRYDFFIDISPKQGNLAVEIFRHFLFNLLVSADLFRIFVNCPQRLSKLTLFP